MLQLAEGKVLNQARPFIVMSAAVAYLKASCAQVWLGFLMNNAILPLCMVYTVVQPHIDWSGVRYYKSKGRVVRVEAGPLTTCAGAS